MIDKNQPAYPTYPPIHNGLSGEESQVNYGKSGISIRQYYAAKAMQGLLANPEDVSACSQDELITKIAIASFKYADAMIKFENKEE